jgi:hypothetical protein
LKKAKTLANLGRALGFPYQRIMRAKRNGLLKPSAGVIYDVEACCQAIQSHATTVSGGLPSKEKRTLLKVKIRKMRAEADLLESANKEWEHWGKSKWNLSNGRRTIGHTDDERPFAKYVLDHYCSVGGGSPSLIDISNDHYFWSAVGIAAIFAGAGFTRNDFPFSQAHSTWIRKFVKARKENQPALYHAFRLNEPQASPQVGDMVGYTYAQGITFEQAQAFFDRTGSYPSHTDVVVARREDRCGWRQRIGFSHAQDDSIDGGRFDRRSLAQVVCRTETQGLLSPDVVLAPLAYRPSPSLSDSCII